MTMDMEMLSSTDLKNLSQAKVLIVEDNVHNQELFTRFLNAMEITQVKCAGDGISGIQMLGQDSYDLVILDVVMPNMNGEEFLYKIKQEPEFQSIPVIVQTGTDTMEAKDKMFKAGASDFITKPVSPMEFFSRVRVHLENRILIKKLTKQIEKMSYNMSLVRRMQESLYPDKVKASSIGNIYNLALDYRFEICEKIGGDFWDVIKVDDDNLMLVVGDASGFGIATSMNIFRVKMLIDDIGIPQDRNIGKYMSDLNDRLQPLLLRGQYVAMLGIWFDFAADKLYYTNAGYPSPMIKYGNGEIKVFNYKGNPLGIAKNTNYTSETLDFHKGDKVYAYGSLVINGKDRSGNSLGIEGIKKIIMEYDNMAEFIDVFKTKLADSGEDDLTAISITRL